MAKMNVGVETSSWINIAAGIAIAGVAWYDVRELTTLLYAGVAAGVLLVLMGAWTAYDAARASGRRSSWVSGASALVGAFVFAYPFFVDMGSLYYWGSLGIGALVTLVSLYEVYAAVRGGTTSPQRPAV